MDRRWDFGDSDLLYHSQHCYECYYWLNVSMVRVKFFSLFSFVLLGISSIHPYIALAVEGGNLESTNCTEPETIKAGIECIKTEVVDKDPKKAISGDTSYVTTFINVIFLALTFVAALGLFFLIWGGFQYITSFGDEEKTRKAKTTIFYALVGIVVVALSFTIIETIRQSLI